MYFLDDHQIGFLNRSEFAEDLKRSYNDRPMKSVLYRGTDICQALHLFLILLPILRSCQCNSVCNELRITSNEI